MDLAYIKENGHVSHELATNRMGEYDRPGTTLLAWFIFYPSIDK